MKPEVKAELNKLYNEVIEICDKAYIRLDNMSYLMDELKEMLNLTNKEPRIGCRYIAYDGKYYYNYTIEGDSSLFAITESMGVDRNNTREGLKVESVYRTDIREEILFILLDFIVNQRIYKDISEKYTATDYTKFAEEITNLNSSYYDKLPEQFGKMYSDNLMDKIYFKAVHFKPGINTEPLTTASIKRDDYWEKNARDNIVSW